MSDVLSRLVEELNAGTVRVVDLTIPLGPDTVVIDLPPMFAPSKGVTVERISRYDDDGPAWYWNNLSLGEHTGTHFDAPIHWVTGKDVPNGTTDTIPARKFVGPACVIDMEAEVEADPDFLLTPAGSRRGRRSTDACPGAPGCFCAPGGVGGKGRRRFSTCWKTARTRRASTRKLRPCWRMTARCSE